MNPRKLAAGIALAAIIPAIAIVRYQMTNTGGDTLGRTSTIIVYVVLVIVPAWISEHLWRRLEEWMPEHREATFHSLDGVAKHERRERARIRYNEITTREADAAYEAERLRAIYETAYQEARNQLNRPVS